MHKNFTVAIQNMLRNAAAVKDWKTSGNSSCDINKRLINGKIRLWTYPRARETWMSVWNKNCYFGSQLHLIFWISNEKSWTWNCNICSLSISQPASQTMEEKEETQTPPPEMYGGKNMPFANWELLFPGLDPGKELILSEFWQWSPRSSLKSTDMLQHVTKAAICFWKEFSKFSKMTLELKIYVVHSSPCVPQGLRQLGWVPTMC